jgi:hypothetical protein
VYGGSHLFLLEQPAEMAALVTRCLAEQGVKAHGHGAELDRVVRDVFLRAEHGHLRSAPPC